MIDNPFKNLKIKNYYTYLLVIGGIVLFISLIYKTGIIPQGKLALLSMITIVYGLIEWIRESQINDKLRQLNNEWQVYWEEESAKKGFEEIMDKSWEANLRKEFKKKYKINKLIPNNQIKTWLLLALYLVLITLVIYFL